MSTSTSITTTYAGEFAGKYIAAALLPAPTLANNLITIMPNVKFKSVMKRLATDKLLSNASCDFNPTTIHMLICATCKSFHILACHYCSFVNLCIKSEAYVWNRK